VLLKEYGDKGEREMIRTMVWVMRGHGKEEQSWMRAKVKPIHPILYSIFYIHTCWRFHPSMFLTINKQMVPPIIKTEDNRLIQLCYHVYVLVKLLETLSSKQ
jgi:hypothetical protein